MDAWQDAVEWRKRRVEAVVRPIHHAALAGAIVGGSIVNVRCRERNPLAIAVAIAPGIVCGIAIGAGSGGCEAEEEKRGQRADGRFHGDSFRGTQSRGKVNDAFPAVA